MIFIKKWFQGLRNRGVRPSDIASFREWVVKVPYLDHDVSDTMIASFIKGSKGHMEVAKAKFDNFHSLGVKYPDIYGSLDPRTARMMMSMESGYVFVSNTLGKDGSLVIYGQIEDPDGTKFYIKNSLTFFYILLVLVLSNAIDDLVPLDSWNGKIRVIWNNENFKMLYLSQYTPQVLKASVDQLGAALPLRLSGIHVIKAPSVVEKIFMLFKSFMPKKLAERASLNNDISELQKIIGKDALPRELGGNQKSAAESFDEIKKCVFDNIDLILNFDKKMRECAEKRPKKADDDIIVGSFKKLDLD